jgi:hypothetical protein
MRRGAWRLLAAALGALFLCGCMERIDGDLPVKVARGVKPAKHWALAGKFGGDAEVLADSADPWEVRFKPGGFKRIAGVNATADEVWVCDTKISRIQVFDFSGRFLRSYGAGMPLEGTLLSDLEQYNETKQDARKPKWEDGPGARFIGRERDYFCIADVCPRPDGYWAADQLRTSGMAEPKRQGGVFFVPFDGSPVKRVKIQTCIWPGFISDGGSTLGVTESAANKVGMIRISVDGFPARQLTKAGSSFTNLMKVRVEYGSSKNFLNLWHYVSGNDNKPASFNWPGGTAFAFGKLVACDPGNHRLQVFDSAPNHLDAKYGTLIRIIGARTSDGSLRFANPLDIDIDADGGVYLLDGERMEIGMLNSSFQRTGRFANKDLISPYALDLSDDGRHCFVTDKRLNMVLHYAVSD